MICLMEAHPHLNDFSEMSIAQLFRGCRVSGVARPVTVEAPKHQESWWILEAIFLPTLGMFSLSHPSFFCQSVLPFLQNLSEL